MTAVLKISWITMRELLYEKVFYLLLGFAILSIGVSLLLGQMTYDEHLKLILDFTLAGIHLSMVLFSVFMGISLFHREMQSGSIFMVLSKPVTRSAFLMGKFMGQITIQAVVMVAMALITYLICFHFEDSFNPLAVFQSIFLIGLEAVVLVALTYFLAVNAGAITSSVVILCVFLLGHSHDIIHVNLNKGVSLYMWHLVKALIPNLEIFNTKALASYGITISGAEMGWAFLYALICISLYLLAAVLCFKEKDIT